MTFYSRTSICQHSSSIVQMSQPSSLPIVQALSVVVSCLMTPLTARSLMKWNFVSMFSRSMAKRLLSTIAIAPWLSVDTVTCPVDSTPKCFAILLSYSTALLVSFSATYSASADDSQTYQNPNTREARLMHHLNSVAVSFRSFLSSIG